MFKNGISGHFRDNKKTNQLITILYPLSLAPPVTLPVTTVFGALLAPSPFSRAASCSVTDATSSPVSFVINIDEMNSISLDVDVTLQSSWW